MFAGGLDDFADGKKAQKKKLVKRSGYQLGERQRALNAVGHRKLHAINHQPTPGILSLSR
jgi:hypothetical protein